ncbi:hypothetical protein ACFQBQ_16165 [Granulicella cerasi]|uniref:Isoamylase 1-3-like C-terminal domain-containing protein n=1 Tax=Granulicella cerasi TaxID=741063 RepID=A0ABW1ZC83_9BACT|nr:hypothetical protein [Granulicella cerasi]
MRRFVSMLTRMRRRFGSTFRGHGLSLREMLEHSHIEWHGAKLYCPDFSDDSNTLAATVYAEDGLALHMMLNAFWQPLQFAIPPVPDATLHWFRVLDTFETTPECSLEDADKQIVGAEYLLQPRSIALLGIKSEKRQWPDLSFMARRTSE